MAQEIKLPALGENVEEAEVLKLLVSEGDSIAKDQPLAELETDKATVEIPAPANGIIRVIHVAEGDRVRVGQLIFELEDSDAEASDAPTTAPAVAASEAPPAAPHGDAVQAPRLPAPVVAAAAAPPTPATVAPGASAPAEPAPAAPSVRRLAREIGVDVDEVPGSGPSGRISVEDVKAHARRLIAGGNGNGAASPSQPGGFSSLPDFARFGEIDREPMRGVRRKTAENMTRSWLTIPHVTQFDRADITDLEISRKHYGPRVAAAGSKLTVTAIVIKVLASAVRVFPDFNASLDVEREEIIRKHYVNIGVAVDTDHGLLVPVIRNADEKNVAAIGAELTDLSTRARERKIRPDDLQGANLTVTNLGGLGTTFFTPLINWPEVAVLGVGRANIEAVHRDGSFEPRRILPLSVSYDHRLIDGADAARFLRWVAEALENPFLLALEG